MARPSGLGVLQLGTAVTAGAGIRDGYTGPGGSWRWSEATDTAFGSKLSNKNFTLTNGQTGSLRYENALIFVLDSNANNAMFNIRGGLNASAKLLDSQNAFSATKDNAGTTNIYYAVGLNDYYIQNSTGGNMTYNVFYFSSTQ